MFRLETRPSRRRRFARGGRPRQGDHDKHSGWFLLRCSLECFRLVPLHHLRADHPATVHEALELDGQAHDYSANEWLPAVYDIAAPLLEAARLKREPPSLVEQAPEAVRWLSRAIVDLDEDSPDAAAALVDGLGHMLALHVFAGFAGKPTDELNG